MLLIKISIKYAYLDPLTAFVYPTTATVAKPCPDEPPCLLRPARCKARVRRTSSI